MLIRVSQTSGIHYSLASRATLTSLFSARVPLEEEMMDEETIERLHLETRGTLQEDCKMCQENDPVCLVRLDIGPLVLYHESELELVDDTMMKGIDCT